MGKEDRSGDESLRKSIKCKQFGVDILGDKCHVSMCQANTLKFRGPEFNLMDTSTNCIYYDFANAGFPEEIDYAIQEQGFVGLRDLSYISEFFGVKPNRFRDLYIRAITGMKNLTELQLRTTALIETKICTSCGHPLHKDNTTDHCISASLCDERVEAINNILPDIGLECRLGDVSSSSVSSIWWAAYSGDIPDFLKPHKETLRQLLTPSCFKGDRR